MLAPSFELDFFDRLSQSFFYMPSFGNLLKIKHNLKKSIFV